MAAKWTISRAWVAVALALGGLGASAAPMPQSPARTIPAGTQFNVLLQTLLNSSTAKQDQRFETAILEEVKVQGQVVLEVGAQVRGFVSSARPAAKNGSTSGQLTLSFDELRLSDKPIRLRASVVNVLDPRRPDETRRASTASVVGGGNFGLAPMVDLRVNAGGTIVSTSGSEVKLPVGIVLRIQLHVPLEIPAMLP